jgi:phosphomannomutase
MNVDAVFKAYDIRGRTDTGELTPELYRLIGSAFVDLTGAPTIAIGRDVRLSSQSLFESLAEGIAGAGSDVIDLGEVPTDLVYFHSGWRNVPGAVITASHNPAEYNGLKLCREGAAPVGAESGLADIKAKVLIGKVNQSGSQGSITVDDDPVAPYVDHLLAIVGEDSIGDLRVAVDSGNGMGGVTLAEVFSRIDARLDGIYLEPDGTFPNHPADPIQEENLQDLIALVSSGDHDLGVAFDGDADRAFFIDDLAVPLSGSTVTSLIARWMLDRDPGASIVHNLITSNAVPEIVTEMGGTPVRTRVGHSYIKQIMAETGAVFGGEHSGHYYFKDNYRADSGMLAMLVLLRVLWEDGRPLSEVRKDVERYVASGERNYRVEDPASAVEGIGEAFPKKLVDRLDGLTVVLDDSWFNVRPSNTEPLLRLNVEAKDSEQVDEIVNQIESILEEKKR